MGIGSSRGDDRAVAAAEMAISSPLLEASIDGAHGVLLSIQGGSDLGLFEINESAQLVANSAAVDANIIFGAVIDDALGDEVRVTVIAAGFDEQRPGRPAAVAAAPIVSGRSPAAPPAGTSGPIANGAGNGNGASSTSANGSGGSVNGDSSATSGQPAGTSTTVTPATASWGVGGAAPAGRGAGESRPATEPPASATTAGAAPAAGSQAGTTGASSTWSVPSSSYSSEASSSGEYTTSAAADPIAEVPVQPASDGSPGYVPSSVSFVSEDDEEYGSKDSYGGYDRDRGSDAAQGGTPGWKDSGRAGKPDKAFDVPAGRRRPVVFEEEDDLDVPDFLK